MSWKVMRGGLSRQVQFVWTPILDRNFHNLENGLSRQGGLSRGGRSKQVSLYSKTPVEIPPYV